MLQEDPFATFKAAFEVQKSEIQSLLDRVSELERANTEVLSYVKEHGSLPVLNCVNKSDEGYNACSIGSDTELKHVSFNSSTLRDNSPMMFSSGERAVSNKTAGDPPTANSSLLSDLVTQHAVELNKALETLGLEPAKRSQLLDQVQLNLHSILHSQLAREIGSSARPTKVAQHALTQSSRLGKSMDTFASLASSGDGSTPGGWPLSSMDALAFDKSVDLSSQSQNGHVAHVSSTPLGALSPTVMEVKEKRRMELMRLNQRMQNPLASTNAMSPDRIPMTCGMVTNVPSAIASENHASFDARCLPSQYAYSFGSAQFNNDLEPASVVSAHLQGLAAPITESVQTATPFGLPVQQMSPQNRLCPCGNQQNCPLTPAKQHTFASDPRVARGFTLLAAAFRGRLVRQLLATHKVYDLIRTVKDTAKLALSFHMERQASSHKSSNSLESHLTASNGSSIQGAGGLSAEELVLESRLMIQLRGALNQLHDIFFNWPLSNQLDLLALSRSLPQRSKRLPAQTHNPLDGSLSAEPPSEVYSQRGVVDPRRRLCSSTTAQWKSRSPVLGETRVLRQLQPHEVDRRSTPAMATEPSARKTEKPNVPTVRTDGIGPQITTNTVRASFFPRSNPTPTKSVSERLQPGQASKSDTSSHLQWKTTTSEKRSDEGHVFAGPITTRHTARLHTRPTTHSTDPEHTGSDEQQHRISCNTPFTVHGETSPSCGSGQLLQYASNVSKCTSRKTIANVSRICHPHARTHQSQSTPSNPVATSRRVAISSNGQCGTARHSPDADVENRDLCSTGTGLQMCACSEPASSGSMSSPGRQKRTAKSTVAVLAQPTRLEESMGVPVADSQIDFRTGHMSGTRAILERSALAMAKPTKRLARDVRFPYADFSQTTSQARRSVIHGPVGRTRTVPARPITVMVPDQLTAAGNHPYPVRRRIVAHQPRVLVSSVANQPAMTHPYYRAQTNTALHSSQPLDPMHPNYGVLRERVCNFPPTLDMDLTHESQAPCRPTPRRWCDDELMQPHPRVTHSPARLPAEAATFTGGLRATWSLDSFNAQIPRPSY